MYWGLTAPQQPQQTLYGYMFVYVSCKCEPAGAPAKRLHTLLRAWRDLAPPRVSCKSEQNPTRAGTGGNVRVCLLRLPAQLPGGPASVHEWKAPAARGCARAGASASECGAARLARSAPARAARTLTLLGCCRVTRAGPAPRLPGPGTH